MQSAAIPDNEQQRLQALRELNLLDTDAEERFDRLTRLAKQLFSVPIALVSLIDENRQWFKSKQGLEACETGRDISFCGHAILSSDILQISDATADPRFADNPLVTGEPHIRFYAGAPLHTQDGSRIGTLCIIDRQPKTLTEQQRRALRDLANCVEDEVNQLIAQRLRQKLQQSEQRNDAILKVLPDALYVLNRDGMFIDSNQHTDLFAPRAELLGKNLSQVLPPAQAARCSKLLQQVFAENRTKRFKYSLTLPTGDAYFAACMQPMDPQHVLLLSHNCTAEHLAKMRQESSHLLTSIIARIQSGFIAEEDRRKAFDSLLDDILQLTQSEYGFIGEVQQQAGGAPFMKAYSATRSARHSKNPAFQASTPADADDITHLNTAFGQALLSGKPVFVNDPSQASYRGVLPKGYPTLRTFLGMPIYAADKIVAILGIANCPHGYEQQLVDDLSPLLLTIGQLIAAAKLKHSLHTSLYGREREHLALNQHAIVSITDYKGSITYVNDKFCQISGYSRAELIGKNHRIIKSPTHDAEFFRKMWRTISRGELWQGEICNQRKDGSLYWVASSITPFIDDTGRPYQYVSVRTDISQIKAAEATQRAQSRMREMISSAAAELLGANSKEIDAAIEHALGHAGTFLHSDRAYLVQLCDADISLSQTHQWHDAETEPLQNEQRNIAVTAAPWWWQQSLHEKPVLVNNVSTLAAELRQQCETAGLRAFCTFPIRRGNNTIGFIGFDQLHQPRDWDTQLLSKLELLAGFIGSALSRALSEQQLASTLINLQATLESTKDGILAVSNSGKVLFMNKQFHQLWDLPAELPADVSDDALLALALTRLTAPEQFVEQVQALYLSERESDDLIELKDGRILQRYSKPLFDSGQMIGRVWSFHDITRRHQAEQAAKIAQERLCDGQIYANIGTWEWNIVSGDLYWTERIAPLFGYPAGDLETSYDNFMAAVHPDDRQLIHDAVTACVEPGASYDIEHRVVWPDGSVHWLSERGDVQRDAKDQPQRMIGVVQDITARKAAEAGLIAAREEADRANQAKSEFLSRMSHELRTPMNAILGFAQILQYDAALDQEQQDNVQEILKAGNHLLELINEVLDLAKVESGRLSMSFEPVQLGSLVQESLSLIQPLAQKRQIKFSCTNLDNIQVYADRSRLKQVLLNLLSNAVKYNVTAGKVHLSAQPDGQSLRLTVSDTGKGIAPERMQELFQPFNRLDAEHSEIEGSGIGLTITRRLLALMGGSIDVQSEPGVGSSFCINLPLEETCTNFLP